MKKHDSLSRSIWADLASDREALSTQAFGLWRIILNVFIKCKIIVRKRTLQTTIFYKFKGCFGPVIRSSFLKLSNPGRVNLSELNWTEFQPYHSRFKADPNVIWEIKGKCSSTEESFCMVISSVYFLFYSIKSTQGYQTMKWDWRNKKCSSSSIRKLARNLIRLKRDDLRKVTGIFTGYCSQNKHLFTTGAKDSSVQRIKEAAVHFHT